VNFAGLRTHATAASGAWAAALLQFLAGVIIVRSLTPLEVGVFFFGVAIATFVFGVFDFRIEEGLTQLLVREVQAGRESRFRPAVAYAVGVDLITGAAILGVALSALWLVPWELGSEERLVAAIAAFAAFIGAADGSFVGVLYAQQAFGWLSAYQVVMNGGRCVALLALPIETPADAAWATVLAQVVATTFVGLLVVRRLPRASPSGRLSREDRRGLVRFSVHVAVASAVATVRGTAIPLLVGALGTKREVAFTRVAEAPTRLLGIAAAPLRTVLFPRLSSAWARRDRRAARRLVRQYLVTTTLLAAALGTGMALAMDPLLTHIYGEPYDGIAHVGQIFVLAAALDAVAGWQKVAPAALDRPWLRSRILLAETAVLVGALTVLVPREGPIGAAISATLAAGVSLATGAYWLRPAFTEEAWAVGTKASSGT
jgi:O-antigen/teichoic acid export membrane protein